MLLGQAGLLFLVPIFGIGWGWCCRDSADTRDAQFRDRSSGLALGAELERGDHGLVVWTTMGVSTWNNFKQTVRDWIKRDITFHWLIRG